MKSNTASDFQTNKQKYINWSCYCSKRIKQTRVRATLPARQLSRVSCVRLRPHLIERDPKRLIGDADNTENNGTRSEPTTRWYTGTCQVPHLVAKNGAKETSAPKKRSHCTTEKKTLSASSSCASAISRVRCSYSLGLPTRFFSSTGKKPIKSIRNDPAKSP